MHAMFLTLSTLSRVCLCMCLYCFCVCMANIGAWFCHDTLLLCPTVAGTQYGRGVYFASNASYSSNVRYATPDGNGHQHMYLARVLTGEYTTGQRSFLVPPPKDPNNTAVLYDSVVDNVHSPAIFVIFYDPQAYPEYHIEFC